MSENSRFRGSFHKWHGKRAETLLTSEPEHFYHIYWSLWTQFSRKKSLLVICKILGLLFYPLTADDKYSLLKRGNLLHYFQMQLSQKRNIFSDFSLHFRSLELILNIIKKKITLIAAAFLNLPTGKNVVR